MNNREYNLMLLKKAAAGKLTVDDLTYNGEPVFDICLDLKGTGACKAKLSEREIQRLKARGQYFDITLNMRTTLNVH